MERIRLGSRLQHTTTDILRDELTYISMPTNVYGIWAGGRHAPNQACGFAVLRAERFRSLPAGWRVDRDGDAAQFRMQPPGTAYEVALTGRIRSHLRWREDVAREFPSCEKACWTSNSAQSTNHMTSRMVASSVDVNALNSISKMRTGTGLVPFYASGFGAKTRMDWG